MAEILLYSPSVREPGGSSVYGDHAIQRLNMLYSCLNAAKAWQDLFLSIPTELFPQFPMTHFCQLAFAQQSFLSLVLLEAPGWDLPYIRESADCLGYMDRLIQRFDDAGANIDPGRSMEGNDVFSRCSRKLRRIRTWLSAKYAAPSQKDSTIDLFDITNMQGFGGFDEFDENFWSDIMGEWDRGLGQP
jgi:hypothetical protein